MADLRRSSAGGVTIDRFDETLERYLDVLHRQLKDARYWPRAVQRVELDGDQQETPVRNPTVIDTVCQQAPVSGA
jgi:hypothetical protein